MLLDKMLKKLIQIGTLNLIDADGKRYCYQGKPGPNVTVRLHNKQVERQLLWHPELALGEAYMQGTLTIENPNSQTQNIYDLLNLLTMNHAILHEKLGIAPHLFSLIAKFVSYVKQFASAKRSQMNVAHHYDLDANFYQLFLDLDRQYSCAYFKNPNDTLEIAQINKKQHIMQKLLLQPGQRVLDIGCGFGGMALYLAKNANVEVVGLTLSKEQLAVATERARQAGLSDRVKFYLRDYRFETTQYDRIVSVGMFEHVGLPQYQTFFDQCQKLLTPDGIMLLHSIGLSSRPAPTNPWILKYIFPGGYCPSLSEVIPKVENSRLYITDIEILRDHYAETLRHWRNRFMSHWDKVKEIYSEEFCRMWEFYLACCETGFRNQDLMVFQIQMTRNKKTIPLTRDYLYQDSSNKIGLKEQQMKNHFLKSSVHINESRKVESVDEDLESEFQSSDI